ncbi:MAG: redoxin domain-containing protein [Verrucomicrobiales bacterium]
MTRHLLLPLALLCSLHAQSLNEQLDARKNRFLQQASAELIKSQNRARQELESSDIYQRVLKVGDSAPDFILKNHQGHEVRLHQLLAEGPVILNWYRGAWCPYCNLTLAALAEKTPELTRYGAQFIALTPELPDVTADTVKSMDLPFQVLTDLNHEVAEAYGLRFPLNAETAARYEEKFELTTRTGPQASKSLPLPATYLISPDGIIRYAFVDADYRRRVEPNRLIDALQALQSGATGEHLVLQFWENTWNPPYDLDLIDRLMTPDFVITTAGNDISGRSEFKEWVRRFQQKAPNLRLTNQEIFTNQEGNRVTSRWLAQGENGGMLGTEADGQPIEFTGIAIWEIHNGKLAHNWVERSAWELFQRLQEQP